ncbi:MAG: bis(5'-nucleosyl)-tetraphosphatase (symmetrical) YqeK [Treponema sp.]|nr:bis(5'-nucleosyl)-tetraphosphatase (symmetrical) YqeK [Treponema sp.]
MQSELFDKISEYTKTVVKESRFEHSMRTAKMFAELCRNYGLPEEKAWIAGIAHDMCKDVSDGQLFELAQKDGRGFSEMEKTLPFLLHGRAAAVRIQEMFGVTDGEIIDAIANHTSGSADSCDFALLLFVADKIEPGRPQSTDDYRSRLLSLPLKECVLSVIEENIAYLEKKGKTVDPVTLKLREKLLGECARHEK